MTIRHHPFGWATPYVAGLIDQDPDFVRRLLTLTRTDQHFLGLCLALLGPKADDPAHLAWFARTWERERRTEVLAQIESDAPAGLIKLLPKLRGRMWRPATYRRLTALFGEDNARKALRRREGVSRRDVFVLSRLRPELRRAEVMQFITRRGDLEEVVFCIEIARRVRSDLSDRQLMASLKHAKGCKIRPWVRKHYANAPFPPAPWGGTDDLRPIDSHGELERTAREFKNCIRDYVGDVLQGRSYFYRYGRGDEGVAVIELRRLPQLGWAVHEALGPENADLDGGTRTAFETSFQGAGIVTAPPNVDPEYWFFD
ncbi:MAG: hypothetical protein AAGL49_03420 [Pseudomonadota bacterium]